MPSWITLIRDIVWTAVGSVVATIASIITAIVVPNSPITIALAGTAITLALLAQRDQEMPEEKKYAEPVKVDLQSYIDSLPAPAGPEVVGLGVTDPIYISQMIYKNNLARRSLSVHHLQRRLKELGLVIEDRDGWFGDGTKQAILDFQRAN